MGILARPMIKQTRPVTGRTIFVGNIAALVKTEHVPYNPPRAGWVAEWSKAAVLKTAECESAPGVRIPSHPLYFSPSLIMGKAAHAAKACNAFAVEMYVVK